MTYRDLAEGKIHNHFKKYLIKMIYFKNTDESGKCRRVQTRVDECKRMYRVIRQV